MNKLGKSFFGIVLIVLAIGVIGSQFHFWHFTLFFHGWWYCLWILLGIYMILENGVRVFPVLLIVFGIYLFLVNNGWISFRVTWELLVALLLLYVGMRLLWPKKEKTMYQSDGKDASFSSQTFEREINALHIDCIFSSKRIVNNERLDRVRIENTMGSTVLDISQADLQDFQEMQLECVLGNVEVIVPKEVNIICRQEVVLSSCEVDSTTIINGKTVYVYASCTLGTIKIRKGNR